MLKGSNLIENIFLKDDITQDNNNNSMREKNLSSTFNEQDLCQHLYKNVFLRKTFSDVQVEAFGHLFPLHKIILFRSPTFASLLKDEKVEHLDITEEMKSFEITEESFTACLSYLYGSNGLFFTKGIAEDELTPDMEVKESKKIFELMNVAHWMKLEGLLDVCCGYYVSKLLSRHTVIYCVFFTEKYPNISIYSKLRNACVNYLSKDLPYLCPIGGMRLADSKMSDDQLLDLYADLPFSLMKEILEDNFTLISEFEKYRFAQKLVEKRNKNIKYMHKAEGDNQLVVEESVYLLFDTDSKGRVSLKENLVLKRKKPTAAK
jgi:hypothetical protein